MLLRSPVMIVLTQRLLDAFRSLTDRASADLVHIVEIVGGFSLIGLTALRRLKSQALGPSVSLKEAGS